MSKLYQNILIAYCIFLNCFNLLSISSAHTVLEDILVLFLIFGFLFLPAVFTFTVWYVYFIKKNIEFKRLQAYCALGFRLLTVFSWVIGEHNTIGSSITWKNTFYSLLEYLTCSAPAVIGARSKKLNMSAQSCSLWADMINFSDLAPMPSTENKCSLNYIHAYASIRFGLSLMSTRPSLTSCPSTSTTMRTRCVQ